MGECTAPPKDPCRKTPNRLEEQKANWTRASAQDEDIGLMSNRTASAPKALAAVKKRDVAALDAELTGILGPPPVLEGEDLDAYNALHDRVCSAVAPADVIEELWVRDVVDLTWETLRLRRVKTGLVDSARHAGLSDILSPFFQYINDAEALVREWLNGDTEAAETVERLLARVGADESAIRAATVCARLHTFERIDQLIMRSEVRRNAVLREIDHHRDAVARRLREALTDIDDAEEVMPTDSAAA
jgi:hypothetical protein